jgi:hypothetical protein
MDLITAVFTSSQDINVVAAIILPLDDTYVKRKSLEAGDGLAFTLEQRVRLWRGHVPHDWIWVYDRGEREWGSFRRELEACAILDGFELEFVGVAGPDYIRKDESPPWNTWGCRSIIASNASRPADFATADTLSQLRDCEAWERVAWSYSGLTQYVKRQISFMAGATSLLTPTVHLKNLRQFKDPQYLQAKMHDLHQAEIDRLEDVRVCRRKGSPDETIRFIRSRNASATLSSTSIRRYLVEHPTRTTVLSSKALNPEILVEIMASM